MAKDYAKVPTKGKKKPLRSRGGKKSKEGKLWIVAVVATGLFILGLMYLKKESVKLAVATEASETVKPTVKPTNIAQPHFDFYTSLPNGQTSDSKDETETDADSQPPSGKERDSSKNAKPATPSARAEVAALAKQQLDQQSESTPSSVGKKDSSVTSTYIVQFAMLEQFVDADALKAQLVLQGLEVNINPSDKDGVTWYRVWAGPFKTQDEAEKLHQALKEKQIKSTVVKNTT